MYTLMYTHAHSKVWADVYSLRKSYFGNISGAETK